MESFPVYILKLGNETRIVFSEDLLDIGHTDFWEETVSQLVADFFHVPQAVLRDMPYCQRRARIVGNTVYYGEESDPVLLESICRAVGDDRLVFVHDDHEKRLRDDVRRFSAVQCGFTHPLEGGATGWPCRGILGGNKGMRLILGIGPHQGCVPK